MDRDARPAPRIVNFEGLSQHDRIATDSGRQCCDIRRHVVEPRNAALERDEPGIAGLLDGEIAQSRVKDDPDLAIVLLDDGIAKRRPI